MISPDSEGGLLLQRLGGEAQATAIAAPDALPYAEAVRFAEALRGCACERTLRPSGERLADRWMPCWRKGNRHPLQLPIGIDDEGAAVQLDLREAARGGDGPHGLIVGATGSGKSELLRTLLTAAAHQNDPAELAFLLVDFKGGAALSELGRLPHTAGLLTNLTSDPHAVDRLCAALRAELRRRQALLRLANADDIDGFGRARTPGSPDTPRSRGCLSSSTSTPSSSSNRLTCLMF